MRLVEETSHFEAFPRQFSIMIYGAHATDYIASCQITVQGDRGMMHSISGVGWFRHWEKPGEVDRLLEATGTRSLEGYATPAHARLMQRSLKHVAKVSLRAAGNMAGRPMVWVVVEAKEASPAMAITSVS